MNNLERRDVVIIGGGQSALATAYFLRRENVDFVILDANDVPGGAWTRTWESLKLFSPKEYSSLPGWMMPPTKEAYPSREEIINYLTEYEKRYGFDIRRPTLVRNVSFQNGVFNIETDKGTVLSKVVVSSTGNWSNPYIPLYKGRELFQGKQIHSAFYKNADEFKGKRVLIVGGGNSAAQILAEVSKTAETIWVTKNKPEFLPDEVDGRYLFNLATRKYQAMLKGEVLEEAHDLAKIVMVDSVKDARARGVLKARGPFDHLTSDSAVWSDGYQEKVDAIIWCTGFKPNLKHLSTLSINENDEKINTAGPRSLQYPGLWFVGYGDWAGFAAATLIGVQRWAKLTAQEIVSFLNADMSER